jgi:hypothetical protein
MVPLRAERAWHSLGTFTALFSLLISAMTREMGDVLGRISDITALRQKFIGYVGPSLAARVDAKPSDTTKPTARRRKKPDPS